MNYPKLLFSIFLISAMHISHPSSSSGSSSSQPTLPAGFMRSPQPYGIVQNNQQNTPASSKDATESAQKIEKRKRDIFFKTVATFKVGSQRASAKSIIDRQHPLIEYLQKGPYLSGNGGLLNPVLKGFDIKKTAIGGQGYSGVQIDVSGCVAADGLASYEFDNTNIGDHYQSTLVHEGKTYQKSEYQMSMLEEAILGTLKERAIDRQTSVITDHCFHLAKTPFADRFTSCIKHEWTSKQSDQDSGIRTPQESELIQRHMTHSAYWPSRWNNIKDRRAGETMRLERLDGENDPHASIELNEFEVKVKIPGNNEKSAAATAILGMAIAQQQGCAQQ